MKFKHTFHVFVDNFGIIYKQLLYRLIILLVSGLICSLAIYPFIKELIDSPQLTSLIDGMWGYLTTLLNGDVHELGSISLRVKDAYADFLTLLQDKTTSFVLSGLLLLLVYVVSKWFSGLGNYATAAVINDKMALRANSPFLNTLISNLKSAAVYNAIYVPLSIAYDLLIGVAMFFLLFFLLNNILYFLVSVFLFVLAIVVAVTIKMTFTCDWLPALIRGKKGQLGAFKYTFSRTNKSTMSVVSNFAVMCVLIFALNSAALMLTFGVGLLLTIPSSYVMLICFEFVNYYDREEIKYFVEKHTIIAPEKEKTLTREEFFRGER